MKLVQTFFRRLQLIAVVFAAVTGTRSERVAAEPVGRLAGEGVLELTRKGPCRFVVQGEDAVLGKYTCYGEVDFVAGREDGTFEGLGVAVVRDADGDLLTGLVAWRVNADGDGQIALLWRDAVTFSDDEVVSSTGSYARARPAEFLTRTRFEEAAGGSTNIIAILIGL
jgi:hypothetical protein